MAKQKAKAYYKIKSDPRAEKALKVLKFDEDLELQSEYFMTYFQGSNKGYYDCSCPASKFDCRHKKILQKFQETIPSQIDGDKFFCFEENTWHSLEELS